MLAGAYENGRIEENVIFCNQVDVEQSRLPHLPKSEVVISAQSDNFSIPFLVKIESIIM